MHNWVNSSLLTTSTNSDFLSHDSRIAIMLIIQYKTSWRNFPRSEVYVTTPWQSVKWQAQLSTKNNTRFHMSLVAFAASLAHCTSFDEDWFQRGQSAVFDRKLQTVYYYRRHIRNANNFNFNFNLCLLTTHSLTHCCAWPAEGRSVLHIERSWPAIQAAPTDRQRQLENKASS